MRQPGAPAAARAEWATRRERGAAPLIRLMVWIVLRLGRPASRGLLVPICLYFFLFSWKSRAASLAYLARALARPPSALDRWRHYWCFAACVLDRVLLLNDRADLFEIRLHGEDAVLRQPGGCLLFGAHLGSFEVMRALARRLPGVRASLAMYEDNARKTNAVFNAINPALALEIISLGKPGSMLAVRDRLADGHVVGILADRSLANLSLANPNLANPSLGVERQVAIPFLGAPARFPVGPFRMAWVLRRPVLLMVGLYRGGNRYDIHFELLAQPDCSGEAEMAPAIEAMMRRYVARLEQYCRGAPYNWFNFYPFWD